MALTFAFFFLGLLILVLGAEGLVRSHAEQAGRHGAAVGVPQLHGLDLALNRTGRCLIPSLASSTTRPPGHL